MSKIRVVIYSREGTQDCTIWFGAIQLTTEHSTCEINSKLGKNEDMWYTIENVHNIVVNLTGNCMTKSL